MESENFREDREKVGTAHERTSRDERLAYEIALPRIAEKRLSVCPAAVGPPWPSSCPPPEGREVKLVGIAHTVR
jgi:hypothetical protein